ERGGRRLRAVEHGAEEFDDLAGARALRADAQHLGALLHRRQVAEQVVHPRRLGLHPVQRKEGLALAGAQRDAVHDRQAAELAGVLLQVEVAGGEAARRVRQRQAAVGEDLGLDRRGQHGAHFGERVAPESITNCSVVGLKMLSVGPAIQSFTPASVSRRTAPMSLASTRKPGSPSALWRTIRRSTLRSDSDSIRPWVLITTSLPAAASTLPTSSQSSRRSSWRREHTVSPR